MQIYPVFLPLKGCPFRCIYCDQYLITGSDHFDLDDHLIDISNFCRKYDHEDKEIAFFGGTFTALDLTWQEKQFKKLLPFINSKTGIRFSTRPDCLNKADINLAKQYGVRTIELGIQDFSDSVLKQSKRGYNQATAIAACKLVKDNNLDLSIQIMPGLPGFSDKSLVETKHIIADLKPKYVRIYPTLVLKDTKLEELYRRGEYFPLTLEEGVEICVDLFKYFQKFAIKVIKMGVQVDSIDSKAIIAGPYHKAFGELVQSHLLVMDIIKDIDNNPTLDNFILKKKHISKLKGHGNYGLTLLEKHYTDKIFNLTIDTDTDCINIRIKSK